MSCNNDRIIKIDRGQTCTQSVLAQQELRVYKTLSAVTLDAPCRLTVTGHGIPDGWPFYVVDSVDGLDSVIDVNGDHNDTENLKEYKATVIDANTIEINDLNAIDFDTYSGGGKIWYFAPLTLTGYGSSITFYAPGDRTDDLLTFDEDGSSVTGLVTLDSVLKMITLTIPPAVTALITWDTAEFEWDLTAPSGDVYPLGDGTAVVTP